MLKAIVLILIAAVVLFAVAMFALGQGAVVVECAKYAAGAAQKCVTK